MLLLLIMMIATEQCFQGRFFVEAGQTFQRFTSHQQERCNESVLSCCVVVARRACVFFSQREQRLLLLQKHKTRVTSLIEPFLSGRTYLTPSFSTNSHPQRVVTTPRKPPSRNKQNPLRMVHLCREIKRQAQQLKNLVLPHSNSFAAYSINYQECLLRHHRW